MSKNNLGKELLFGALAGFVGTMVINAMTKASEKVVPDGEPEMKEDPGQFMTRKAKEALPQAVQRKIPAKAESIVAQSLGPAYGMTYGALYAALRPRGGSILRDGVILGAVNYAIGYLGWLPASGLIPPPREHSAKQIATPLLEHAAYGAATVAAYDWLIEAF